MNLNKIEQALLLMQVVTTASATNPEKPMIY